jgi:hypothetical protein
VHRLRNVFLVLDAIGLALFTVISCNVALDLDLPFRIVIMSGMITGCVGGVLRDVLCNDIPLLFQSELYASVSVAAGALYVGGLAAGDVQSGQPGLGFLGLGPFSRENLGFEGWKGLDFLGFSRPNRLLSMGYAGFSLKEISRALLPPRQNRGNGSSRFWPMEPD